MILLNPGPVNVSPRVTAALARGDICHREPECAELLARVRARLLEAFAPRGGFTAVLLTGSGTAAVEAAVTSVCSPRGRLVVVSNGVYGERIAAMAEASRVPHTVVGSAWTSAPDLDAVEDALRAPDVEAVAVVHHETTTGLLNPVAAIAQRARALGKLVLVDAVSGLAGDALDLGACDLVVGTGGKCIQAFPGIAFVLVRDEVLARLVTYPRRSLYLSLATYVTQRDAVHAGGAGGVRARRGARGAARGDGRRAHRALRVGRDAPARGLRASRARVRAALRAALEHHHVASLPRRAHLRRAARRPQGARLRHLRRPGRVRQGGVPRREHGRALARRLHALPRGARRGAGGAGRVTAIILAAGVGKRLLGTSGGTPKCLIEIGGRSLLLRLLDGLAAAGVREAVVVTGFGDDRRARRAGGGAARHRRALS